MKKQPIFFLTVLFFMPFLSISQKISTGVYSDGMFGLHVKIYKRLSAETRFNMTSKKTNDNRKSAILNETAVFFKVMDREYASFKCGIGGYIDSNNTNKLIIPFQTTVTPFKKVDYLSFVIEPCIVYNYNDKWLFRTLFGFRINF